jgi:Mg-chelatase subunit ChlD
MADTLWCSFCGAKSLEFERAGSFGANVYHCTTCDETTVIQRRNKTPQQEQEEIAESFQSFAGQSDEEEEQKSWNPSQPSSPKPLPVPQTSRPQPVVAQEEEEELSDEFMQSMVLLNLGVSRNPDPNFIPRGIEREDNNSAEEVEPSQGSGMGADAIGNFNAEAREIDPDEELANKLRYDGNGWTSDQRELMKLNAFYQKLGNIMKDNQFDRYVDNQRKGKLTNRNIYKVHTGSEKVSSRKLERKNKKYAVVICVDTSGSMGGMHIKLAARTVSALIKGLSRHHIRFGVLSFNELVREHKKLNQRFDINELAAFERRLIGETSGHGAGGTFHMAGVAGAREMLKYADDDEQIITVMITDGGAYEAGDFTTNHLGQKVCKGVGKNPLTGKPELKAEAEWLARRGSFITLSIGQEAAKKWFPNVHMVNNMSQFADIMTSELSKVVVRA